MAEEQIRAAQIKAGDVVLPDGSVAFAADQSMGSHKLTNVTDPAGAQDAATKNYVDAFLQGLSWKAAVRAATTANITLSGAQTIDGVSVVAGDRVLVKDQTTGSQNGIYVAASGAWSRSTDADVNADVTSGLTVSVTEGTANGDKAFVLTTNDPITVGTTALTFAQMSGGGGGGSTTNNFYGGGLVLLKEKVASASASIDFTSEITATFDEYIIELLGVVPATDNVDLLLRCSTDGGATFDSGANYGKAIRTDFVSFNAVAGANSGLTSIVIASNLDTTVTQGSLSATIRSYLPLNTSLYKIFTVQGSYHNNDTNYYSIVGEGRYLSATAVNALRFVMSSGNIASGIFRIYGVSKTVATAQSNGGTVLLATADFTNVANVDFVSRNVGNLSGAIFQNDFDDYVFEFVNVASLTNATQLTARLSTDGGATFDSAGNYRYAYHFAGSGGGNGFANSNTATSLFVFGTTNNTAAAGMKGEARLANPLSTSVHKAWLTRTSFMANDGNYYHLHGASAWVSTSAANAIRFLMASGNMSGTIRVYGVVKTSSGWSGHVAQVVNTQTGAVATGTTTIPFDDTIPQNTEGTEFMTLAITPTNANNKLRIEVSVFVTVTSTPWIIVALFQDSVANAIATMASFNNLSTAGMTITFQHYMTAGTTSPTTFKVRIGPSSASTVTFNGQSGGRIFGGSLVSNITITEIVP